MKNKILFIGLSLIFTINNFLLSAQNQKKVDSLFTVLKTTKTDTTRVKTYTALCWEYQKINLDKAIEYGNLGLELAKKINFIKGQGVANTNIGVAYWYKGDMNNCKIHFLKALDINLKLQDSTKIATSYMNIGNLFYGQNSYDSALYYQEKSLAIKLKLKDKIDVGRSYNNIALIYDRKGNYPKSLEFHFKSLKINEEMNSKLGISYSYNNIANIYYSLKSYEKSLDYHKKALKIKQDLNDELGVAMSYSNIAGVYAELNNDSLALEYHLKAIEIREKHNDIVTLAHSYNNIGLLFKKWKDYTKALDYQQKALKIRKEINDKEGLSNSYINLGTLYGYTSEYKKSKECFEYAKSISKEINNPEWVAESIEGISDINALEGDYKKAYLNYKEYRKITDSLFNVSKSEQITEMETKYETEKKENQLKIQYIQLEKKEIETKKQQLLIYSFIIGFIIVILFSILLIREYFAKRKANIKLAVQNEEILQKNEEITSQRDEIEAQRNEVALQKEHIEEIHKEVTDSIHYAKKIQTAVLPGNEYIKERISGDYFILFKPKDIVSGDFYFIEQRNNLLLIAVADCTGHGVPGAFMSMLGISFLNEIIIREDVKSASHVLDKLRQYIINSLQQKGISGEQKDGMDISFVVINTLTNEMQFAGANNSLYLVKTGHIPSLKELRNNNLVEVKGDKMPVAIHVIMNDFTNNTIQLEKGDIIYLMSDGYDDQFGGSKGKKFLSKNLKQLLSENCLKSMDEQKEILENTLENWKNSNGIVYEQTDDITILGLKIS